MTSHISDIIKFCEFRNSVNSDTDKKRKILKQVIVFALMLLPLSAFASNPVTVSVSLSPPYSPFLSEYGAAGVNKLQVTINTNDARMNNYPAKLQMLLEKVGSGVVMYTSDYAAIPTLLLTGNVLEVYSGADLSNFFLASNNIFGGLDQSQYVQTGRIPDGQYRIGFRVVDAQRSDVVLSNTAYTQAGWFLLNDPPEINLPRDEEEVYVNEIQSVKTEWYPRHLGSLNSAFTTSYQVELFPIRVTGMDPDQYVLSTLPDFTYVTNSTILYLTNDNYVLEPGVEYAMRIKAMAGDDQLTLFQNDGYSEVFSFVYGSQCPVPENIDSETSTNEAAIEWDSDPLHTSYETRFRIAGHDDDNWNTRDTYLNEVEISNVLSAGIQYEYQVQAKCTNVESDYSDLAYFTMPESTLSDFECGAEDTALVTNTNPKDQLYEGDIIYYGQFPIKLTEVSGSNGVFSGEGRMRIPFLAYIQVNMEFTGIKVNELNEVYEGKLVSIYNPDSDFLIDDASDYFASGDQVGSVITGEEQAAITLGYEVDNASSITVTVSGNTVTVSGSGGTTTTELETSTGGTTISDSEGNLFSVSEDGTVTQVGTSGGSSDESDYSSTAATYNELSDEDIIEFINDDSDPWAFDTWDDSYNSSVSISAEYEELNERYIPWKLIPEGKSGKVKARLSSGSIVPETVKFMTPTGTEYFAEYDGSEFELTIVGSAHGDAQEIYALQEINDSVTVSMGKLKVASYNIITQKLAIVPIGDASVSADEIKTQLDEIYLPYGIFWEVREEEAFTETSWAGDDGKLDAGESGFFSAYTDEMKALNSAFAEDRTIDDEEMYLFVFNSEAANVESGVLLGDMPISSQYGYIFNPDGESIAPKTIAHELGHGMFLLKHTFADSYGIDQGTTDNLMDYSTGTELVKQQWDAIYDPQLTLFAWLQDDEDGEMGTLCEDIIKDNAKTYQDGDEKLWTNIGGNKLQLITPDIYDGPRNTSEWYEYLAQFYDFYQYKCSSSETFEQIAEKFELSVAYIKKYNPNKQIINGSLIRIPPPEDIISELLTSKYINCFAYLHEIRCLNNNALYILEEMIRINQELLVLNEIKEYSMLVAGVDLTISFIPIAGQVKAVVEIAMGKNVVHYVMFEKMKGIPVNDFSNIDYAQNAIDVLIPGVKVLNSTTDLIRLSNSTIEMLEITGNVNGLINVGRTNYQQ